MVDINPVEKSLDLTPLDDVPDDNVPIMPGAHNDAAIYRTTFQHKHFISMALTTVHEISYNKTF